MCADVAWCAKRQCAGEGVRSGACDTAVASGPLAMRHAAAVFATRRGCETVCSAARVAWRLARGGAVSAGDRGSCWGPTLHRCGVNRCHQPLTFVPYQGLPLCERAPLCGLLRRASQSHAPCRPAAAAAEPRDEGRGAPARSMPTACAAPCAASSHCRCVAQRVELVRGPRPRPAASVQGARSHSSYAGASSPARGPTYAHAWLAL